MALITRGVAAKLAQQKKKKSTHSGTTGKTFLEIPKRTMRPLLTRSETAKLAQQKNKSTHSSTTGETFFEMPKEKLAPPTRSAAAKQAQQEKKSTHSSTTDSKTFLVTKNQIPPITRCETAKQQNNNFTLCPSTTTTGNKTFLETPLVRNPYHKYDLSPHMKEHPTVVAKKTRAKQFHCIFCNKKSFLSIEPHRTRVVGCLSCEGCRAEYRFRVTAGLSCSEEVQAALLVGSGIRWLSATQGPSCVLI